MTLDQAFQLATQHHQAGRFAEAESLYRQILQHAPNHAGAMHFLGLLASQIGKFDAAIDLISRAIQIDPNIPSFHNNLGSVLLAMRRFDEAIEQFRIVLRLDPQSVEANYNLGNSYAQLNRLDMATDYFQAALKIKPDYSWALTNLGNAYQERGMLDPAMDAFQRALAIDPNLPEAHFGLGNVHRGRGELDAAIQAYRRAVAVRPDHAFYSNVLLSMHLHPAFDAQALLQEHLRWRAQYADPLRPMIKPHTNDRNRDRRLRIGYVSPEFRDHVIGQYTVPLLANHDHSQFEIFLYSDVAVPDDVTQKLKSFSNHWRNIAGESDARAAALIREDQIDILIDLNCHLKASRLLLFAQKPAPIQAGWLSYPSTSGLDSIDYRITDRYLDPPSAYDADYTERSVYLDGCYWCYDPPPDSAETAPSPLPASTNGYVTFGCLNNFCKVNDVVLSMWSATLNAIPASRMLILADPGRHCAQTLEAFQRLGVDPGRIEFVGRRKFDQYIGLYHRIDIMLDTYPYNGHTTSIDALWMGVPVVTLAGRTCVSRGGRTILSNAGLPELIADSPQQFAQIATDLAQDLPRLSDLRATLRTRMRASPLCDAAGLTRNMESLYRKMWHVWIGAPA